MSVTDHQNAISPMHYDASLGRVETFVILVVPTISESLQAIIEHEGFNVVSKQWYESED